MNDKIRKTLYFLLVLLGLLQIIGHIIGVKTIKGIGAITAASPLPLVFTAVKGIETFASEFKLVFITENNLSKEIHITPEVYAKFKGPYNRKNIYGAAFAYAPLLPDTLRNTVLENAFCNPGFLKNDLGITEGIKTATIFISSKTEGKNDHWKYQIHCHE